MQPYAERFYKSRRWQRTAQAYASSVYYICERCGKPGDLVHHKRHITPANIHKPEVTLAWDNLQYLCRDCHADVHNPGYDGINNRVKISFGEDGRVLPPC